MVISMSSWDRNSHHIEGSVPRFTAAERTKALKTVRARMPREMTTVALLDLQAAALFDQWVRKQLISATMETAQTSKESTA